MKSLHFAFSYIILIAKGIAAASPTTALPKSESPLGPTLATPFSSGKTSFPVLSEYKSALVRARCQARCNTEYGMQKSASPHEFSDLYRPYVCRKEVAVCQQCSSQCNTVIINAQKCALLCTTEVCRESCSFFNRTAFEEAEKPGISLAPELQTAVAMNLTKPTPACLYSPISENMAFEGSTIVLKWNVMGSNKQATTHPLSFIIELSEKRDHHETEQWEVLGYTNFSVIPITKLDPASAFKFRVSAMAQNGLVALPVASDWIHLPKIGRPQPPRNVTIVQQYVRGHSVRAEIQWTVPNNTGCYFKLYWMTSKEGSFHSRELREWIGYKYELSNLAFEGDYILEIQTYDKYFQTPSDKVTLEFTTLSCLESTNYNYHSCAPDPPIEFGFSIGKPYDVNGSMYTNVSLSWKAPKHVSWHNTIDNYVLAWRKNPDIRYIELIKPDRGVISLDDDVTQWTMTHVHWDSEYIVTIAAESKGGTGEKAKVKIVTGNGYSELFATPAQKKLAGDSSSTPASIYYASIIPAVLGALFITTCTLYYIKLKKSGRFFSFRDRARKEEVNPLYEYRVSNSVGDGEPLLVTDEYEVEYACLKFTRTLGEGAFGKVMKADLMLAKTHANNVVSASKTVAVKMLKEYATPEEKRFLLLEITAMKSLGRHPHMVGIIACVTATNKPCLIMDYCPLGDLRNYLRQHRCQMPYMRMPHVNSNSSSLASNVKANSSSDTGSTEPDQTETLSQTTLLSYARQIASGMEYLNQNRFIHRDLAARNVLMSTHQIVKISDFGLSRDVYETNVYQPTSARKLPFKWMAIESIFDHIFTIKSDVWSYGILLWEIVTLGGCPYPGIPNSDLFRLLNEGYRLERPGNCSANLYQIMLTCWHPNAEDRPSFSQLKKEMENLLEATCSYIDLTMAVNAAYYKNESSVVEPKATAPRKNRHDFSSLQNLAMGLPESEIGGNTKTLFNSSDNSFVRSNKRYSRLDSATLPGGRNFAHYPVSKCPYVTETNEPVPGLSEELLHNTTTPVEPSVRGPESASSNINTCDMNEPSQKTSHNAVNCDTEDSSQKTCPNVVTCDTEDSSQKKPPKTITGDTEESNQKTCPNAVTCDTEGSTQKTSPSTNTCNIDESSQRTSRPGCSNTLYMMDSFPLRRL